MEHVPLDDLVGWILAPLCAALVAYIIATAQAARKSDREHEVAMEQGMRALLRQQLIDYHRRYVAEGRPCPVGVKEQATAVYSAYHGLGGNGTGTHLYEEIMEQHVKED